MSADAHKNATPLIVFVVVSLTVVGYFTGLQSPMNPLESSSGLHSDEHETAHVPESKQGVIPATDYVKMSVATLALAQSDQLQLSSLWEKSTINPLEEIKIQPEEKLTALARRKQNRAFNGAPPTVPHHIEQRSDASCVACHTQGIRTKSLRIPQMSHAFLTNCLQCHVEDSPRHMPANLFRENDFVGLEAPTKGSRAFPGAPPQIPHSTWMRSNCMSCHGYAGLHGIRTTHPWRNNCQQCHAPSAAMDQTLLVTKPRFLSPPKIKK